MRRFRRWDEDPIYEIDYDDWNNSIALFGDSTTYGRGLPERDRLHNKLNSERPVNNFSYPGHSNEHIFKRIVDVVSEHGFPHAIVVGWTSSKRMTVIDEATDCMEPLGIWTGKQNSGYDLFITMMSEFPKTLVSRTEDIVKATRLMCQDKCILKEWTIFEIPFMVGIPNEETGIHYQERIDFGYDDMHPGPKTITEISKYIGTI